MLITSQKPTQTKLAKDAFSTASKTYEKKSSYFSRDSKNYVVLATVIRYIYKLIYSRITDQNELIWISLLRNINMFTYHGRPALFSPEQWGDMIKNCFCVWRKFLIESIVTLWGHSVQQHSCHEKYHHVVLYIAQGIFMLTKSRVFWWS